MWCAEHLTGKDRLYKRYVNAMVLPRRPLFFWFIKVFNVTCTCRPFCQFFLTCNQCRWVCLLLSSLRMGAYFAWQAFLSAFLPQKDVCDHHGRVHIVRPSPRWQDESLGLGALYIVFYTVPFVFHSLLYIAILVLGVFKWCDVSFLFLFLYFAGRNLRVCVVFLIHGSCLFSFVGGVLLSFVVPKWAGRFEEWPGRVFTIDIK